MIPYRFTTSYQSIRPKNGPIKQHRGCLADEMKVFFRKLFNIYPGEEKNAFLFACLGFLWALGVTSGLKFADALFLIHVGAHSLPTVYISASCCLIAISTFLLYAFHVFSTHRIFLSVISVGITFYAFAYFCLLMGYGTDTKWLWYAMRIFGTIMFAVTLTSYWTFIDQYYHLQDAKRLYSLFSSMIFLGVATTGLLMKSGLIDVEQLTLVIMSLLLLTAYWITKIVKQLRTVRDENDQEGSHGTAFESVMFMFRSIKASRFTQLIMVRNFLIYLLLVITEYNYLSSFGHHFDPQITSQTGTEEHAQLTLFLGQWLAVVSVNNLIFGLLIYSRLVRRFGITGLMLVTPLILLFTFTGWQFSDSLLFPILGLFVVEGTLYVIDDSNFNLLLNAVPSKLKYKIRVTIESFFEPFGMLTSALLISYSPLDSRQLGLILALFLLSVSLLLRQGYLKAIYLNLSENAIHFQRTIKGWFASMGNRDHDSAEHRLLAILKQGDEKSQVLALEGLICLDEEALLNKVLKLSDRFAPAAKLKFLDLLGQSSLAATSQILDKLHEWSCDEGDATLKSAIQFYLARLGLLHPEKAVVDLRDCKDLVLKGAAILAMKSSWANLSVATATLHRTLAAQQLQELLESTDSEEICMGLTILGLDPSAHDVEILLPFLRHPTRAVARTAAASIARIADKSVIRYAGILIARLTTSSDNEFRLSCLKALGKMGDSSIVKEIISNSVHFRPNERRLTETVISRMGLRTVPTLLAITKDTAMPDRCRVLAGKILGRLALPQLRANLCDLINVEIERARFYFFHYHTIQQKYPDINLYVLKDALLSGFHSVLDFIIQLLGVAGEIEDCELLSRSLRSRNPKVRSQVVEALEKTCETKIFRILQPLVSDSPVDEKIHAYELAGYRTLELPELLSHMSQSSSQVDHIISAALCQKLDMPGWRATLRKQMSTNEEIFHHFAYELLET